MECIGGVPFKKVCWSLIWVCFPDLCMKQGRQDPNGIALGLDKKLVEVSTENIILSGAAVAVEL